MGCWYETCGFSGLPIENGDPVYYMVIRKTERSVDPSEIYYPFDLWTPVSILAKGTYDDYGGVNMEKLQEDFLRESLKIADISLKNVKYHGTFRINADSNPATARKEEKLPKDCCGLMIRGDCFDMIAKLPIGDWNTTLIGDALSNMLLKCDDSLKAATVERQTYGLSHSLYDLRRMFMSWEAKSSPIYEAIMNEVEAVIHDIEEIKHPDDIDAETLKELESKIEPLNTDNAVAMLKPLLDLQRIFLGMLALRKVLSPTGSKGSQAWETGAYKEFGQYILDVNAAYVAERE